MDSKNRKPFKINNKLHAHSTVAMLILNQTRLSFHINNASCQHCCMKKIPRRRDGGHGHSSNNKLL